MVFLLYLLDNSSLRSRFYARSRRVLMRPAPKQNRVALGTRRLPAGMRKIVRLAGHHRRLSTATSRAEALRRNVRSTPYSRGYHCPCAIAHSGVGTSRGRELVSSILGRPIVRHGTALDDRQR